MPEQIPMTLVITAEATVRKAAESEESEAA
jgi:hypothetical protein